MKGTGLLVGFFDVTVLCLIWLTKHTVDSQLSAPENLTAPYGGSVMIPCHYEQQYRENTKYWCKGPVYDLCSIVVKIPRKRPNDRVFITDDKDAGVFTVTMTSLRDSDTDVYWCVISTPGRNVHKRVKLLVSHTVVPPSLEHNEIRWWAILRWILFILLVCCLGSTHVAVWKIKRAREICVRQQYQTQSSNIYN